MCRRQGRAGQGRNLKNGMVHVICDSFSTNGARRRVGMEEGAKEWVTVAREWEVSLPSLCKKKKPVVRCEKGREQSNENISVSR